MLTQALGRRETFFNEVTHAIEGGEQGPSVQKQRALELRCAELAEKVHDEQGILHQRIPYQKFSCSVFLFLQYFGWVLPQRRRNALARGLLRPSGSPDAEFRRVVAT